MIRSILLLQVSQILGRALYIAFSFWYINHAFGVEGKGLWAALYAMFGILGALSNLGFEVWLTREVADGAIDARGARSFLFRAKGPLWLLCLMIGAWWCVSGGYPLAMSVAFGVALVFEGIALAEQAVFEGRGRAGAIALMSFIKSGGFALLCVPVALLAPDSLDIFAWVFALALALRTVYGWRGWSLLPASVPPRQNRPWLEFAVMGSFTLVTIIYFKVDVLMLARMLGSLEAGLYDNAYQFVEGVLFISAAAGTILYPRLVQTEGRTRALLFDSAFKVILVLGLCGSASIALLGRPFGLLVIGEAFEGSVAPLSVLVFALPVMFVNGLLNRWLFSQRRERFALVCAASVMVFNVVGNVLLIPEHGAWGAALTTVLTECLLMLLWLLWGRRSAVLVLWSLGAFLLLGGLSLAAPEGQPLVLGPAVVVLSGLLLWRIQCFRQVSRDLGL